MISDYPEILILLPVLYAETHYRFKYFMSYLYKREPEIIADIPSRIEPDNALPVLILVKDAHMFPVTIHEVYISDTVTGKMIDSFQIECQLSDQLWEKIHFVESPLLAPAHYKLNVRIDYSTDGRRKTCINDNHRGSSHAPLPVLISEEKLPRIGNCLYGDTHVHTNYTSDQVEFAPSVKTYVTLARSMGLNFFCATDHSYDLDDFPDNYLINDPNLSKWISFRKEVTDFNQRASDFLVIPGEEVSIRNSVGKNVHCLVYNSERFFPGSGDGAEHWPETRSELSLGELIDQLESGSLVFAAHPGERPAFLQRLLINRGQWSMPDCMTHGLTGLQLINNADNESDHHGKNLWIQTLLSGMRSVGICGTDAHGNFSRYRQINFPFFTLKEHDHHLFGQWRTGVYLSSDTVTVDSILSTLKNGWCFMSNGPAVNFLPANNQKTDESGCQITESCSLNIQAVSTPEFSALSRIILYIGNTDDRNEEIHKIWNLTGGIHRFEKSIPFEIPKHSGYLRVEVTTESEKQALSNPIWF